LHANHYWHNKVHSPPMDTGLSNIAPLHIWRRDTLLKEWIKFISNLSLPLQIFAKSLQNPPRLKSRNPPWKSAIVLNNTDVNINKTWKNEWEASKLNKQKFLKEPTDKPPGHNLHRKEWTTLNRISLGHGRCGYDDAQLERSANPELRMRLPTPDTPHLITEYSIRKFNSEPEDMFNDSLESIEW